MKRSIFLPFFLGAFLLFSPPLWAKLDLEGKGKAIALEIATNPGGFLYDLYQMSESVAPTRVGRKLTFSTTLAPALFPFTFANFSGRLNLLEEHPGTPQVEVFGGYAKMIALEFVDSDSMEGSISGIHYGVSLVQSIHPKARVQFGFEKSVLTGEAKFKKKPVDVFGTKLSSIKVDIGETFVLMGAELLRGNRRYLFTQMGYGLESSKIVARVILAGHVWDLGFTVYPEGPLVIYPTFGLRFGF